MQTITISDESAGAKAKILVGLGFNCFEFVVDVADRPVDALWAESGFEAGDRRAAGSGIPILFPFPGRLRGDTFSWKGKTYQQEAGDGRGNAIHGFVHERPWRVVDQSATRVVGEFHASKDAPEILNKWPADFRLTVSYELCGACLKSLLVVENVDQQSLPCGLGTHPYFRVPLGGTSAEKCVVTLPVKRRWELADMLPTGESRELQNADAYHRGLIFADMGFDDVFTELDSTGGRVVATVRDEESGTTTKMSFDKTFRECVVYTPPHREAVCIEPYTCLPGAQGLAIPDAETGWMTVAPGKTLVAEIEISVEHSQA